MYFGKCVIIVLHNPGTHWDEALGFWFLNLVPPPGERTFGGEGFNPTHITIQLIRCDRLSLKILIVFLLSFFHQVASSTLS